MSVLDQEKKPEPKSMLREYVEAIAIALFLALIIRTFVIAAYKIPSGSMLETLQIGDHLLVNKFLYGVKNPFSGEYIIQGRNPERGDIIVFPYPENPKLDYIKRIVGLPEDIIEIRDKQLYINGEAVYEDYIQNYQTNVILPQRDNMPAIVVPEGHYFVMGDNRDYSEDSRFWGFVKRETIHGKAWRFYWSWDNESSSPRLERIGKEIH